MIFFNGLISIYLHSNTLIMKNLLTITISFLFLSLTAFSQEQKETIKINKVEVSKEKAAQLKSAKKTVKAQAPKKVKAVREKEAIKREDD